MKIETINKIKETINHCPAKTYDELFALLTGNKDVVITRLSNTFDLKTIGTVSLDALISSLLDQSHIRESEEPVEIGFSQSGFKYIAVTLAGAKLLLTKMGLNKGEWTCTISRGRHQFFNPWETIFNHSSTSNEQFCKLIYALSFCSEDRPDIYVPGYLHKLESVDSIPINHDALGRSVIIDSVVEFYHLTKRFHGGHELCDTVTTIMAIKLHGLGISDITREHVISGMIDKEFEKLF